MKKGLIFVLVVALVMTLFCNVSLAEEPVELHVAVIKHAMTRPVAELTFLDTIEEMANVKVVWEEYLGSDWSEKKNVILASGDLPDLIIGYDAISDIDIENYNHVFMELTDKLDSLPNVSRIFEENPLMKSLSTTADGKIFTVGFYKGMWPKNWCRMVINKQWLDNLGLEMPTTWDELYDVLVAFKTRDPNGNGIADEIPINWQSGLDGFNITSILGGYGLLSSNNGDKGYYIEDGKVANKYADSRMKELIVFLNKLYSEGLVNPQVFTDDYSAFKALGRSPEVPILGVGFGWDYSGVVGMEWADQYAIVPPLKPYADYDGPQYLDYSFNSLNYGGHCITISQNCKYPEAALRFLDTFYDPEISLQVLFGPIGLCIEKTGENSYHILKPADPTMDAGTWKWTQALGDTGPYYIDPKLDLEYAYIDEIEAMDGDTLKYNDGITDDMIWPATFVKFNADDSAELAILDVDLQNIMVTKFAQWVTSGGVEEEWDAYLQDLNNAGLQRSLEIRQKYFDEYLAMLE